LAGKKSSALSMQSQLRHAVRIIVYHINRYLWWHM